MRRWLAAFVCGPAAAGLVAQDVQRVVAPAPFAASLRQVLETHLEIPVDVVELGAEDPPREAVVWFVDEWRLARWQERGLLTGAAGATFLPFATDHVLVGDASLGLPSRLSWRELALSPALHDRLALVDPAVDGGPWLAMLQDELARGRTRAEAVVLWRTVDARAGRTWPSYAALWQALARREVAAVVPRGAALRGGAVSAAGATFVAIEGSTVRLGVAAMPGVGRAVVDRIASLDRQRLLAIATAVGVDVAEAAPTLLPPDVSADLWQAYETEVRGRGRAAEDLADWLDLVFAFGALLLLAALWRISRRADHR